MASEMVVRVAKALCTKHYAERFKKAPDDPHVQLNVRSSYPLFLADARTAIEAMLEPTPGMKAIRMHPEWGGLSVYWKTMIDQALKEPTCERETGA